MTRLYQDIVRQPERVAKSLAYTLGNGRHAFTAAVDILKRSSVIYIIGIGSSWNAGLAVVSFFNEHGIPAVHCDASELLHFGRVSENAAVIIISRSGKSTEIVQLLASFPPVKAKTVAITNTPDSPLAKHADVTLFVNTDFDHQVSITMYSALALTGGLLAAAAVGELAQDTTAALESALKATADFVEKWRRAISESDWPNSGSHVYFLGRGASLASCHEARLLWEEAAKIPATAMPTGNFRHGPQEIVRPGLRIGMWIDKQRMRPQDLALASDLRKLGAQVFLVGQDPPRDAADLVINLPSIPAAWQFLIDIVPLQIAAEIVSALGKQDCDSFRLCSYIVEEEGGLIAATRGASRETSSR